MFESLQRSAASSIGEWDACLLMMGTCTAENIWYNGEGWSLSKPLSSRLSAFLPREDIPYLFDWTPRRLSNFYGFNAEFIQEWRLIKGGKSFVKYYVI